MVQLQHPNMMGRYNRGYQTGRARKLDNLLAQSGDVAPQNREQFAGNVMAAGGLNESQVLRNVWANSDAQKRAAIQQDVEGLAKTLFTVQQNPQAWGRVRQEIVKTKPEYASMLPEQFDPVWAEQKINEARSFEDLFKSGSDLPSDVQSTQWLMGQPEDVRALHLKNKRGDQVINLGGSQLVRDPMGRVTNTFSVTPKPQDMPGFKKKVASSAQEGKATESRAQDQISRGLEISKGIPALNRGISLLEDIETGGIDKAQLVAKQVFGIESADEGELSNLLGKAVLSQLRETFGAQFTASEGAQLTTIEANIGKSAAANKRLLRNALTMAKTAAKRAKRLAEDRGDSETIMAIEDYMSTDLSASHEVETRTPEATATNPTTNERMGLFNGKWEPIK